MHSKVSFDWVSSYNKATQPGLEIFKMAVYFPDSPCTSSSYHTSFWKEHIALFFDIPVSVTEIQASKEIGVLIVITTKISYTWNITHNTKVFHSETSS